MTPAFAQPPKPKGPALNIFGGREARGGPAVARFVAAGVGDFVLDRSQNQPLIKFGRSSEILALTRTIGPRNEEIYKNDIGEQVLRLSGLGGWTIYTPDNPKGTPVDPAPGPVLPIRLQAIANLSELYQRGQVTSNRISNSLQRHVVFDVPDASAESWALMADTMGVVANAIEINKDRMRQDPKFAHIERILIVEGDQPSIVSIYDTIQITVAPSKGPAGRPSSARIAVALAR